MVTSGTEDSTGGRFEEFGRRVDQKVGTAIPRAQDELKKIIAYLNDDVVPHLRQDSSKALRAVASQLEKLAAHLDDSRQGGDL